MKVVISAFQIPELNYFTLVIMMTSKELNILCVKLNINFYLGTAARTKRKSKGVIFIIYMFLNIY